MVKKLTVESFLIRPFLIGIIRNSFKKTPMFHAARQKAKVLVDMPTKTGKMKPLIHYKCAHCGGLFRDKGKETIIEPDGTITKRSFRAEIAVDHIEPVIPVAGWDDWNGYIQRMFFGELQVLCNYTGIRNGKKSCHAIKTKEENALRKKYAKKS